jgi:hypothetical protein
MTAEEREIVASVGLTARELRALVVGPEEVVQFV